MLLLIDADSNEIIKIAHEIDGICSYFLRPLNIFYFQFRRIFKNRSQVILANNPIFFEEFLKDGFIEPKIQQALTTHQSFYCFWDETLSGVLLSHLKTLGIYHGFTILNRYKEFYDCASFAMSEPHLSPVANYIFGIRNLQNFTEIFPIKAKHLIKESVKYAVTIKTVQKTGSDNNSFFLPKRSDRFYLGKDPNMYITTYEALCVHLIQQGKTYKEIRSILSMELGSIKTLLSRLKTRTGLSFQEIIVELLHVGHTRQVHFNTRYEDRCKQ